MIAADFLNKADSAYALRLHCNTSKKHCDKVTCGVCSKTFQYKCDLKRHMISHSNLRQHSCLFCKKQFKSLVGLQGHVRIHTREKPYSCKICENPFSSNSELTAHQVVHTGEKSHRCHECSAAFGLKCNLMRHIRDVHRNTRPHELRVYLRDEHARIHFNEEPYKCDKCGRRLPHLIFSKTHMKHHQPNYDSFSCSKCSILYNNQFKLERHYLKVHVGSNENILECLFCGRFTESRSNLEAHLAAMHTNEKPYYCDICHNSYYSKSNFKKHRGINMGCKGRPKSEKTCKVCQKSFKTNQSMKLHQLVHTREKAHKCSECSVAFGRKYDLQHHIRTVHRNIRPFPCPLCDKSFALKANLKTQINIHSNEKPYKCDQCGMRFSQPSNMKKHLKRHDFKNSRNYWCSKCSTDFPQMLTFERHYLKEHVGIEEDVLQCLFCEQRFGQRKDLELHIRFHTRE
ncbi:putative zinc finger protein [Orchesella cincta]|uniref:Putative zinc finger protein n=1 Tax=Orchesella cincta TaxID=48709 RepID=A0A1D2M3A9_ORCCI|nr:putative zinc finger protein [Orchesella cincta]